MNFKTLCLSALALLVTVNAAPVGNNGPSIESIEKACQYGSARLYAKTNEDNNTTYACIHKYNENRKNNVATPDNSACYYFDNDVYCVDMRYTNIEECNKSGKNFDYRTCSYSIISLTEDGYFNKLKTYPDNTRIHVDALQDQNECKAQNGIVLTYKVMYQYICLHPEDTSRSLKGKHCTGFDGKVYCIDEDNTIIETCNKHSKYYDHDECNGTLLEYARANGLTINEKTF